MMKNFTQELASPIRVKRDFAQPAERTLELLRNFARTYSSKDDLSGRKAVLVLQ